MCLGATAAQAMLGKAFRVAERRGELITGLRQAPFVMATLHPSAILRIREKELRHLELERLVADLAGLAQALRRGTDTHP